LLSSSYIIPGTKKNLPLAQVSAIVPIYNQATVIANSLSRIREALLLANLNFEIVVVNDGSSDNTLAILEQEKKKDSRLKIISYPQNKGKGYAIKQGVMRSSGDIAVFIDGDLDIKPSAIKEYIDELNKFDFVIASKRHPLSRVNAPISRKVLSRIFNLIVRTTTGIKVKDTQSGLKVGNGNLLRNFFKVMNVNRYAFDVELLALAALMNLNIKEMPVEIDLDHRFRIRQIILMLKDVLDISYRYRIRRFYQKRIQTDIATNVVSSTLQTTTNVIIEKEEKIQTDIATNVVSSTLQPVTDVIIEKEEKIQTDIATNVVSSTLQPVTDVIIEKEEKIQTDIATNVVSSTLQTTTNVIIEKEEKTQTDIIANIGSSNEKT
jgi:glycosyltransferase involved in cell wall biosynthesis